MQAAAHRTTGEQCLRGVPACHSLPWRGGGRCCHQHVQSLSLPMSHCPQHPPVQSQPILPSHARRDVPVLVPLFSQGLMLSCFRRAGIEQMSSSPCLSHCTMPATAHVLCERTMSSCLSLSVPLLPKCRQKESREKV